MIKNNLKFIKEAVSCRLYALIRYKSFFVAVLKPIACLLPPFDIAKMDHGANIIR